MPSSHDWRAEIVERLLQESLDSLLKAYKISEAEAVDHLLHISHGQSIKRAAWWPEAIRAHQAGVSDEEIGRRFRTNVRRVRSALSRVDARTEHEGEGETFPRDTLPTATVDIASPVDAAEAAVAPAAPPSPVSAAPALVVEVISEGILPLSAPAVPPEEAADPGAPAEAAEEEAGDGAGSPRRRKVVRRKVVHATPTAPTAPAVPAAAPSSPPALSLIPTPAPSLAVQESPAPGKGDETSRLTPASTALPRLSLEPSRSRRVIRLEGLRPEPPSEPEEVAPVVPPQRRKRVPKDSLHGSVRQVDPRAIDIAPILEEAERRKPEPPRPPAAVVRAVEPAWVVVPVAPLPAALLQEPELEDETEEEAEEREAEEREEAAVERERDRDEAPVSRSSSANESRPSAAVSTSTGQVPVVSVPPSAVRPGSAVSRGRRWGWRLRVNGQDQPLVVVAEDIAGAARLFEARLGTAALVCADLYPFPLLD